MSRCRLGGCKLKTLFALPGTLFSLPVLGGKGCLELRTEVQPWAPRLRSQGSSLSSSGAGNVNPI